MFNFTPLLGAQTASHATQSLLEFEGGIKVLIDLGWDDGFDIEQLRALEKHISSLSIILLTHATPSHIAAFAHCCKHFPSFTQIPIYATTPVISLGRTLLQDIYASTPLASTLLPKTSTTGSERTVTAPTDSDILLPPPTAEEIASYFNLINPLRYSQPHQPIPSLFSPPLNGLTITAYNAGHTLGGTIWHIQHGMESVVYAVDWNLTRENVISGASWLDGGGSEVIEQLRKPTALVCSSRGIEENPQAMSRPKRDELLVDMVKSSLNKGGIVLIPSDSSARVLELCWLLEGAWRKNSNDEVFRKSQLVLASKTAGSTMDFTRSMIEWMDENVTKAFEGESEKIKHRRTDSKRANDRSDVDAPDASTTGPFNFKHLKLVETYGRIQRLLGKNEPMVIIASDTSLGWGFSQKVVKDIASNPNNLVILTNTTDESKPNLSSQLWQTYKTKQNVVMEKGKSQSFEVVPGNGGQVQTRDYTRADLDAAELATYQQYLATQRQLQVSTDGGPSLDDSADAIEEASVSTSSSEESDDERQGKSLNFSSRMLQQNRGKGADDKEFQGVNALLRKPGFYDWDVRGKKGREAVFPFFSKRKRADEYGELIRPEDYLRAEERDEIEGKDMRETTDDKDNELGEKRKWGEVSKIESAKLNGKRTKSKGSFGVSDSESSDSESEDENATNGPTKLITNVSTIELHLGITHLDFSGIHDGRSLTMLIPLIRPRKVILTGGSKSDVQKLAAECCQRFKQSNTTADDILTPENGERVAASMDANAWTVKLSRDLVKKLQWQEVKGLEVVTLVGRLKATTMDDDDQDAQRRKRQRTGKSSTESPGPDSATKTESQNSESLPPTLDVLPASLVAATRSGTSSVHVGDLRLADLRKILQSAGHTADFRGEGILVVDNLVAVKKSANGRIELESTGSNIPLAMTRNLESPFNVVKKRIYEGLAVIAGG